MNIVLNANAIERRKTGDKFFFIKQNCKNYSFKNT